MTIITKLNKQCHYQKKLKSLNIIKTLNRLNYKIICLHIL